MKRLWLLGVCWFSLNLSTQAQFTLILEPIQDNTLYSDGDFSNGMGDHIFVGQTASFGARRALIQFDLAAQLPPDAVVTEVSLTLVANRVRPGSRDIYLHALTRDWGEGSSDAGGAEGVGDNSAPGDATWTHAFIPDTLWSTPGGDFVPTPSVTTAVDGMGTYTWSSAKMVDDLNAWLTDPSSNFGWSLVGEEG